MKWKCLVCGYIHEGDQPPDQCPVCGVGPENFVPVEDNAPEKKAGEEQSAQPVFKKAVHALSYGLFIVTANHEGKDNGQTANTCFQVTSEPVQIAIGINKNNYTHALISQRGKFGISILDRNGHDLARAFGYKSGRDADKFAGIGTHRGKSGILLLNDVLATLEADVADSMDAGTHTLFLGRVTSDEVLGSGEPMTYDYFRKTK